MSSELEANNADSQLDSPKEQSSSQEAVLNSSQEHAKAIDPRRYSPSDYLADYSVEDDPLGEDPFAQVETASNPGGFYAARPVLSRGFDASAYSRPTSTMTQGSFYAGDRTSTANFAASPAAAEQSNQRVNQEAIQRAPQRSKWAWLLPKHLKKHSENQSATSSNVPSASPVGQLGHYPSSHPHRPYTTATQAGNAVDLPPPGLDAVGTETAPVVAVPKLWEKQPYRAIAYLSATVGTLVAAWLLGLLAARIVPGTISRPPLQESVLRKSNRLASKLWHLPQMWQTPTAETRIEAIPLPETGPLLEPVALPPLDRQPIIDELNAVETELLSLDRRIQTLEKRLGKPPYQGTDIESRINGLRGAVDPPVRTEAASSEYKPTPRDPQAALLSVAKYKIVLPSDALFAPGDSVLKDSELLNQILDQLVNYPEATVIIRSYSDEVGEALAAREYTLAQAMELSEYLARSLPQGYRWVTIGGGQTQPIEPNDSAPNRQRNRRIEIFVDTR